MTPQAALPRTQSQATCFYEADPSLPLVRRGLAEGVGTLLLMFVVTVSGMMLMGSPQSPSAFAAALAAPAALVGLVVAFGAVSGGHYNPLITILQWLGRERTTRCTLVYVGAQLIGALAGAWLANETFGLHRVAPPTAGDGGPWVPEELIATAGLMIVIFGCARSGRVDSGPFAVGTWLVAIAVAAPRAYVNPALAVGALVAAGPVALSNEDLLRHVPAQCVGALIAFGVIRAAFFTGKTSP